ncbi:hypothetical protein DFH08DRAFT_1021984 [Mycena albidolilacea]|uniref:Uncharacterized protein n=1 Tax=Mycena albidolilacea TaxID=1033008 RepID=A0AAD6ZP22_9AGAR|nr:hypothetical protein DFH08DRAFT_1021984 [Mycena albidolilacea]
MTRDLPGYTFATQVLRHPGSSIFVPSAKIVLFSSATTTHSSTSIITTAGTTLPPEALRTEGTHLRLVSSTSTFFSPTVLVLGAQHLLVGHGACDDYAWGMGVDCARGGDLDTLRDAPATAVRIAHSPTQTPAAVGDASAPRFSTLYLVSQSRPSNQEHAPMYPDSHTSSTTLIAVRYLTFDYVPLDLIDIRTSRMLPLRRTCEASRGTTSSPSPAPSILGTDAVLSPISP